MFSLGEADLASCFSFTLIFFPLMILIFSTSSSSSIISNSSISCFNVFKNSPQLASSTPENTITNFGPMYLTKTYCELIFCFTILLTSVIMSLPVCLLTLSFISSIFIILNIHTADVGYLSNVLFPIPYKYSAEYNPVNLSVLTIDSIADWYDTVDNTEIILSFTTSIIVVSKSSKACILPLSIIQYPI